MASYGADKSLRLLEAMRAEAQTQMPPLGIIYRRSQLAKQPAPAPSSGGLCLIGLHHWHPTIAVFRCNRLSKLICVRCGIRNWWRQ